MAGKGLAEDPKKGAKTHARIAFVDESGVSERPSVRRTWAPKGQTPVITSSGSWTVRSVIGVLTSTPTGRNPRFYLWIVRRAVRKEDEVRFLRAFRKHERGKVILLWDNLGAHKAKIVREEAATQKLALEYFPPYAPELNPVEYVWATGKNHDLANIYPEGLAKLDKHIRRMQRRLERRADLLAGFLRKSGLFS